MLCLMFEEVSRSLTKNLPGCLYTLLCWWTGGQVCKCRVSFSASLADGEDLTCVLEDVWLFRDLLSFVVLLAPLVVAERN